MEVIQVADKIDLCEHAYGVDANSPCTRRCELNPEKICLGCFRTIDEIVEWSTSSTLARIEINKAARTRREFLG